MTPDEPRTGPLHRAARIEARVSAVIAGRLRSRGWRPAVVPHVGYGSEGWVRLFARVLLVPPGSSRVGVEDARGWRRFVTTEAPGTPVTVRVGSRTHHATSDREGYLDLRLDSDLGPGWSRVSFAVGDAEPVEAPVHVVGPETRLGLVSDIDDTVIDDDAAAAAAGLPQRVPHPGERAPGGAGDVRSLCRDRRRPPRALRGLPLHRCVEHRGPAERVPGPATGTRTARSC